MKKIIMSILVVSILFSCDLAQGAGKTEEPIDPTTLIPEKDFTGEIISSDTDFENAFMILGYTFTDLLVMNVIDEGSLFDLDNLDIDLTNYTGSTSYDYTDTLTAIDDNAVGQATVSASGSIDNNLLFISIPFSDSVIYVPKDLTIFDDPDATGIADGEVSIDLEASTSLDIEDYTLEDWAATTITVEEYSANLETALSINVTDLNMDITDNDPIDLDGGLLDLTFSYTATLAASISSSATEYKGGKIVIIAEYERSVYNIDISTWDEDLVDQLTSDGFDIQDYFDTLELKGEILFGDFSNVTANYYVYDNDDVEQFHSEVTLQAYFDQIESILTSND